MTVLSAPAANLSPQPAIGEQTMTPNYLNGASHMPPTGSGKDRYFVVNTNLVKWIVGGLFSAAAGGYIFMPAKDSEFQAVKKEVAAHTVTLTAITEKLDKIGVDVATMRATPAAPVLRVRKPKPKPADKPTSILGVLTGN